MEVLNDAAEDREKPSGERPVSPGRGAPTTSSTLDALPFGVTARVLSVRGTGAVARRLMEMGVVPGAPIRVIKAAPLGDPVEVQIRGYRLALRRTEAQTIEVIINE